MAEGVLFEIAVIVILSLMNGFLAMSEIAIVSARKVRLGQMAAKGNKGARVALDLAEEPSDLLAAVQIGITLIGVLAGAFGGATISQHLDDTLRQIPSPLVQKYADAVAFGTVVVGISLMSLIFGELVPKRIALVHAEVIAAAVARPVKMIANVTAPAVRFLSAVTAFFLRILRIKEVKGDQVTEDEVKVMIEMGAAQGIFEREEETMMKRVLRLGDQKVGEIMTQRLQMVFLDVEASFDENLRVMLSTPHSYYPMYDGSQDHIIGLVSVKLVISLVTSEQQPVDLRRAMMEPLYVAETMPAINLLEHFKRTGQHLALAVDEYGGTAGIVTVTDVLEAIAGDLTAASAAAVSGIAVRSDGSWLVEGVLSFYEFCEHLAVDPEEEEAEEEGDYQSVGGFVMAKLRRIPKEGDSFEWRDWRLEVIDMDGRRVDKVLMLPLDKSGAMPKLGG